MSDPFFTDNAVRKMKEFGLSEAQVMDAYNKGDSREWSGMNISTKKYSGYDISVFWNKGKDGRIIIISAKKRDRR